MSPEFLKHIYEPYAREMRFSDRQAGGTGLGMSITKHLVAQMDGEIQVESAPGAGTTFTVILPLAAAGQDGGQGAQPPAAGALHDLEGRRILLAEDNEINMEIAAELDVYKRQGWTRRYVLDWYVLMALIALELLMSFSFLGYFHIAPISITIAFLPVRLAGALLGPLESTVCLLYTSRCV